MTYNASTSKITKTMSGLVQKSHNGPDDLVLEQLSTPEPSPGEYLIKVGAGGLNFSDFMQTHGTYGGGPDPAYVAGFEAAGEIVAVGSDIADPLPIGTHVIGIGPGAFAHYMVMAAAAVAPVPAGWSDAESLGLVLNWATALATIKPLGNLAGGEWVLVHAAAGGVGQAAVRLAKHYGAKVVATASAHKHDVIEALGADLVLDRQRQDLTTEVLRVTGGVDLVLESIGRSTFSTSLAVTKPFTGRIVVFGAASGDASVSTEELVFTHRVQIKGLHIGAFAEHLPEEFGELLDELANLIDLGVYTPGSPKLHPLADGRAAMQALGNGDTVGKLAIAPWS